jgi:hypothetical protein
LQRDFIHWVLVWLLLATSLSLLARTARAQVWSDEFNGTQLDTGSWTYDAGGHGWGNNELQFYTARPENVRVGAAEGENALVLSARRET